MIMEQPGTAPRHQRLPVRAPGAADQQVWVTFQPRGQLPGPERRAPRRGQLDGQRHAIQPLAHLGHRGRVVPGERENGLAARARMRNRMRTPGHCPVSAATIPPADPSTCSQLSSTTSQHSPVRRYPWQEAYNALLRLMARTPASDTLTSLEYRNPVTGGPVLATLGCLLESLPAGARSPEPGAGRAGRPPARS
jgi:hypothetical protein